MAELRALRAEVRSFAQPATPTVTVAELWLIFLPWAKTKNKDWRKCEQRWRNHVEADFGARAAADVGISDVDKYRTARVAAGAKMGTINREIALLRRLLSVGVRRRLIPRSALHGPGMTSELIHPEHNVRTTIIEEDPAAAEITLADLLAEAGPQLRAYILAVHNSGFRRGEAAYLRWDRIDKLRGIAWLPSAATKGDSGGRVVPLSSPALEAMEALPRRNGCPFVFWAKRGGGAPIHPDTWSHRFGRLVRRMGLDGPDGGPPWLHDLRRSFVTLAIRRGEDRKVVKKVTGHITDAVFDRYDAIDIRDVLQFRSRAELARAELAAPRKPAKRAPSQSFTDGSQGVHAKNP